MPHSSWATLLVGLSVAITGCTPDPVDVPYVNASSAASAAIKQYDSNSDGQLSEEELIKAPGIKAALATTDSDSDRALTHGELKNRIAKIVGDEVGMMSLQVRITYDGKPLPDATVRFVPESCLGAAFKTGVATTDAQGMAVMRGEGEGALPGMQCGWFRAEISKKDAGGTETIPARYNQQSILGAEVAEDVPNLERGITLELHSKEP